uniref:Uncharacterized protein n=1 Tax=Octopus bimaculoides TaxID=37653 RepID=A0A0L8GHZ1_OCTBM
MKHQTAMRNLLHRSLFVCLVVLVLSLHLCSSSNSDIHERIQHKIRNCMNSTKPNE